MAENFKLLYDPTMIDFFTNAAIKGKEAETSGETQAFSAYKSPITITESTIDSFGKAIIKQQDDAIFAEIQASLGIDVDRQELIRALQYERDQYKKGYSDGKKAAMDELVRCKDCKYYGWEQEPCHGRTQHFCKLHKGLVVVDRDTFCSYGERREGE